jgi:transposase InsO family protein
VKRRAAEVFVNEYQPSIRRACRILGLSRTACYRVPTDAAPRFIEPGKPNQNVCIERFNRTYRDEVLSANLFESTEQVQQITDDWLIECNELRPHDSLGRAPPSSCMPRELPAGESSFKLFT